MDNNVKLPEEKKLEDLCSGKYGTVNYCIHYMEKICPMTCSYSNLDKVDELVKEREECNKELSKTGRKDLGYFVE